MTGMTASEMAEKLKLPLDTVKKRLHRYGRKPFSQEALYIVEDFEAIKDSPGKGRPPKAKAEPEDKTALKTKPKKAVKKPPK
jgi:hypothetical protein